MTHPAIQRGNVAVVTGGASGIGLAVALRLAADGLAVCIADLPGPQLEGARDKLAAIGAKFLVVPIDVADVEQIRRLEGRVTEELGAVNVLVNNAGIQPGSSIFDAEAN